MHVDVEVGAMEVNQVIAVQAHPVLVMKGQEEYTVVASLCKADFKLLSFSNGSCLQVSLSSVHPFL